MTPTMTQIVCKNCESELSTEQAYYNFSMLSAGNVTVSGGTNFKFIDQSTEQEINPLPPGQTGTFNLAAGSYRILLNGGETTLSYSNSYKNISFNFYNQKGQPVGSIDPAGVQLLLNGGINNYATKADLPFTSLPVYDQRGRLLSAEAADSKKGEFIYRVDGKLRFSQDAEQKLSGRFSYVNYDTWGRMVEAGEFQPAVG